MQKTFLDFFGYGETSSLGQFLARGVNFVDAACEQLRRLCTSKPVDGQHALSEEAQISKQDVADISLVLHGDAEAYRRLIQRYQLSIAKQMWRFTRDPLICEELVQDVFVEGWNSLKGYDQKSPLLHWFRKIATRVGYRFWKQQKKSAKNCLLTENDWQALRGKDVNSMSASEASELIHVLLAQLPTDDRLVLTLLYLESCTISEIASQTSWTVTTTKVRAFRARNKLRKLLEREIS